MRLPWSLLSLLACCGQFVLGGNPKGATPLLRGTSAAAAAKADDEPLAKPLEPSFSWQISGLAATHKVPMQLVLTSKFPDAKDLPAGVRGNMLHTLSMDAQMRVRWLDDSACLNYIQKHFTPKYADMFRNEKRGSFRGDICRACVLYREGGFYSDLDLQLRLPLTKLVDTTTTFMSCWTEDGAILNAIIAAAPRSPVMRGTLQELMKWYNGEAVQNYNPDGSDETTSEWKGPLTMLRGLRSAMGKECSGTKLNRFGSKLRIPCGSQEIMLYHEAGINCNNGATEECPEVRLNSDFIGLKFGMFSYDKPRTIIGWPRFDGCTDWGCKSGGWDESQVAGGGKDL